MTLSHINDRNQPGMVDVGAKAVTRRTATAQAEVVFPPEVLTELNPDQQGEIHRSKGPVFQTAIIAGTMAVKQTPQLIPLCHPIPVDACDITIQFQAPDTARVACTVSATHKTGVEMEALTGATVAALTIYDMCKALSHGIEIRNVRLLNKSGGKSDYHAEG